MHVQPTRYLREAEATGAPQGTETTRTLAASRDLIDASFFA